MFFTLSRDQLKKLIDAKAKYILIDLRRDDEVVYGMIPTAKRIPMEELDLALGMDADAFRKKYGFPKFKKEDKVIFYCHSGGRSSIATAYARKQGYRNALNFA